MGPLNRVMWQSFGIGVSRYVINNSIPHSLDKNRQLFFLADALHLLKCLRNTSLFSNKIITTRKLYNFQQFTIFYSRI